jgi:hypothetical protein
MKILIAGAMCLSSKDGGAGAIQKLWLDHKARLYVQKYITSCLMTCHFSSLIKPGQHHHSPLQPQGLLQLACAAYNKL